MYLLLNWSTVDLQCCIGETQCFRYIKSGLLIRVKNIIKEWCYTRILYLHSKNNIPNVDAR